MRRRVPAIGAMVVVLMTTTGASTVAQATAPPDHKVTICHRTGSVAGGNTHIGYSIITVDIASSGFVRAGHHLHEQVANGPGGDIIPAYDYTRADGSVFHYPGKNLTTSIGGPTGEQILANGCKAPPREFEFEADASSHCDRGTGHVIVEVEFTNLSDNSVTITITEITFTNQSQTVTVAPDETVVVEFDIGLAPKPGGQVTIDLGWTDMFPGVDTVTIPHSPTNACVSTTTVATTTPAEPPSFLTAEVLTDTSATAAMAR